jgi:uncharacterized protein (TIGR00369 family)|uniref:Thioesterase superfamily protein n=1 Tax=Shewanella putrefaciens (strain 200) TaxID=399804 RepID=E6XH20_SHEP2
MNDLSRRLQRSHIVTAASQLTEQVPHARDLGIQVVLVDQDQVRLRLTPQSWMFAQEDTKEICTSILYSLADSAGGLAVIARVRELMPIATLDLRMDYLRPANGGLSLLAVATCRHLTDQIAFIDCDIFCEADSELLATAKATFMRNTHGQQFHSDGLKKNSV